MNKSQRHGYATKLSTAEAVYPDLVPWPTLRTRSVQSADISAHRPRTSVGSLPPSHSHTSGLPLCCTAQEKPLHFSALVKTVLHLSEACAVHAVKCPAIRRYSCSSLREHKLEQVSWTVNRQDIPLHWSHRPCPLMGERPPSDSHEFIEPATSDPHWKPQTMATWCTLLRVEERRRHRIVAVQPFPDPQAKEHSEGDAIFKRALRRATRPDAQA